MIKQLALINKLTNPLARTLPIPLTHSQTSPFSSQPQQTQPTQPSRTHIHKQYQTNANKCQTEANLLHLYHQHLHNNNNNKVFDSHIFAITCRCYARIIRRKSQGTVIYNVGAVFGKGYENLGKVGVEELTVVQLHDVLSMFSVLMMNVAIQVDHPVLRSFMIRLLDTFISKSSKQQIQRFSQKSSAARCAQNFHLPQYHTLLLELSQLQSQQRNTFQCLALFNCILKGQPSSKITQIQLELFHKFLNDSVQHQWIQTHSLHTMIDFMQPVQMFLGICGEFQETGKQYLRNFQQQLRQIFTKYYQTLTGQQIIRLTKFLLTTTPTQKTYRTLLKTIFKSIKNTGESTLDPIFILRLLTFCKNFHQCDEVDPDWEEKIVKLFQFYFVQNCVESKLVFYGVQMCLGNGMFGHEATRKILIMILDKIKACKTESQVNFHISGRHFLPSFAHLMIQNHLFEQGLQYLHHINKITSESPYTKRKYNFLYQKIFQQITSKITQIQSKSSMKQKPRKFLVKQDKKLQDYILEKVHFQTISKYYEASSITQISYLRNVLLFLGRFYQYQAIFKIVGNLELIPAYQEFLSQVFFQLSIPQKYQQECLKTLQTLSKSQKNLQQIYFSQLKIQKNVNLRSSQSQAQFFLLCTSTATSRQKLTMYSNNIVCYFLMVYARKSFMQELTRVVEDLGLGLGHLGGQEVQFLYLRVLGVLVDVGDRWGEIGGILGRMCEIRFASQKIFGYFYHMALKNGLLSQSTLAQIAKNQSFQFTPQTPPQTDPYLTHLHKISIPACTPTTPLLTPTQQTTSLQIHLQNLSKKLQENPQNRTILMKDLVRVLRYFKDSGCLFQGGVKEDVRGVVRELVRGGGVGLVWEVKGLGLMNQLGWEMPELFAKVSKNACRQLDWKYSIPAQQIFSALLTHQSHPSQHLLHSLIKISDLCPDLIPDLHKQLTKPQNKQVYPEKMRNHVKYLNSVLSQ